jgi:hypothetical protein
LSTVRVRVGFGYNGVRWGLRGGRIATLCGCSRRCWAGEIGRDRSEWHRKEVGVCLEEEGREGGAKERSYNKLVSSAKKNPSGRIGNTKRLTIDPLILCAHGSVDILAIRAKQFDCIDSRRIHSSTGQDRLTLTKHSRTYPKGILFEPFSLGQSREEIVSAFAWTT